MARIFTAPSPALAPLRNGADIIQCNVHLVPTNYILPKPVRGEEIVHSTVLVSFLSDTAARRHLRSLRGKFLTVECNATFVPKPGTALPPHFAQQTGAFATAVIALPSSRTPSVRAVQSVLHALRCCHHLFTLVVGISADPRAWAKLDGLDGWVKCSKGAEATAAAQLFTVLATLTSPETLNCIDDSDVADALGPSSNPAQLCEGVWIRPREEVVWLSPDSQSTIRRCSVAIAFPLSSHPTLGESARIYQTVRALAPSSASVYSSACTGFLAPELASGAYPVLVLCRK